jgi:ribonuclease Z
VTDGGSASKEESMGKKKEEHKSKFDLTRRDVLKIPAVALGAMACGSSLTSCGVGSSSAIAAPGSDPANTNSLFNSLPVMSLYEPLDPNEMRVTFLGTSCIPRLSQECNSVYVEVGNAKGQADQFVFDCGTGAAAKYNAMGIPFSKMNKIFFTHLHGDHTSDLIHIYAFSPAEDRKFPLYVFGPGNSGLTYTDPEGNVRGPYADGTVAFLAHFREMSAGTLKASPLDIPMAGSSCP